METTKTLMTTLGTSGTANTINTNCIPVGTGYSLLGWSTLSCSEQEELWDFLWVYVGEDEEEEEFPHEGKIYGTKSEVEKTLLVQFARLYTDVDVDDYQLKLRKW